MPFSVKNSCFRLKIGYNSVKTARVVGEKIAVIDSVLELLSFALLGQTKANTKSYNYDMNIIKGTTLALCNSNTINNPLSGNKYGFFIQIVIPYENNRTGFYLQIVFPSLECPNKEIFYRTFWNDKAIGTWNKVSVS